MTLFLQYIDLKIIVVNSLILVLFVLYILY